MPPLASTAETIVAVGGVVSGGATTVQRTATGEPVLPARSRARTANVCGPSASLLYETRAAHAANARASRRHVNDDPGSLALNANDASGLCVSAAGRSRIS